MSKSIRDDKGCLRQSPARGTAVRQAAIEPTDAGKRGATATTQNRLAYAPFHQLHTLRQ